MSDVAKRQERSEEQKEQEKTKNFGVDNLGFDFDSLNFMRAVYRNLNRSAAC